MTHPGHIQTDTHTHTHVFTSQSCTQTVIVNAQNNVTQMAIHVCTKARVRMHTYIILTHITWLQGNYIVSCKIAPHIKINTCTKVENK